MKDKNNTDGGGIGFCGLLTIAFIVLKLTGFISWSWWVVLAPLWVSLLLVCGLLLLVWLKGKQIEWEILRKSTMKKGESSNDTRHHTNSGIYIAF